MDQFPVLLKLLQVLQSTFLQAQQKRLDQEEIKVQLHSPIIFNGRVARVLVAPTTIFHVSKAGPNVTFIKTMGKEISLTKLTSTRRLWYQVIRNLSSELVTKKPT